MEIPEHVEALAASGALFVANHSGGKDSQAQLIKMIEVVPAAQIVVVHASLGAMEWPGAMELARDQAVAIGLPFIVAKASKTLLEMVTRRFEGRPEVPSWPSASTRQCTSDLKRGPIQREVRRYAKGNGFKVIVNCLGLRAQESPGRAKRRPFRMNESPRKRPGLLPTTTDIQPADDQRTRTQDGEAQDGQLGVLRQGPVAH